MINIADLFRGFQAFVFAHEGVFEKDLSIWPFVWVFPEDKINEAFDLRRSHCQDGVFCNDLVQVVTIFYHERIVL